MKWTKERNGRNNKGTKWRNPSLWFTLFTVSWFTYVRPHSLPVQSVHVVLSYYLLSEQSERSERRERTNETSVSEWVRFIQFVHVGSLARSVLSLSPFVHSPLLLNQLEREWNEQWKLVRKRDSERSLTHVRSFHSHARVFVHFLIHSLHFHPFTQFIGFVKWSEETERSEAKPRWTDWMEGGRVGKGRWCQVVEGVIMGKKPALKKPLVDGG